MIEEKHIIKVLSELPVEKKKKFEALVDSYMEFATQIGIPREDVVKFLLLIAYTQGKKFICLNCLNSRADKMALSNLVQKEGRISLFLRKCGLGYYFIEYCEAYDPIFKEVVPRPIFLMKGIIKMVQQPIYASEIKNKEKVLEHLNIAYRYATGELKQ